MIQKGVSIRAVSYTHLDVYKRQINGHKVDFNEKYEENNPFYE